MKLNRSTLIVAIALAIGTISGGAWAASAPFSILPTPENNSYATYGLYTDAEGITRDAILMNGIPIAFKYDDFWSYSAPLLNAIQTDTNPTNFLPSATFGSYDFTVGTGTIAVNITSNAGGATNLNPNGSGVNFQDPVDLGSSNVDKGWQATWGGLTQTYAEIPSPSGQDYGVPASSVNGTVTVGNLRTYLNSINPGFFTPVFYADYNQTGTYDSLWFSAKFEIWDSTHTTLINHWELDRTLNNGVWDQAAPTFNYGELNFFGSAAACTAAGPYNPVTNPDGCAGVTANGDSYLSLDHNKGSGKPDFLVFAPDMDLTGYAADYLFEITMNLGCIPGIVNPLDGVTLGCNTNGGEEFGIVGAVGGTVVPEPSSIVLAGLGLLGLCIVGKRRLNK